MNYYGLAACLALLAFWTVSTILCLLAVPVLRRAMAGPEPRGALLLALRWSPTLLAALFVGAKLLPAFLWLEPRRTSESVSAAMLGLTGACVLMLAAGPLRGLLSLRSTWRLTRRWRDEGTQIALPGVAIPALAVDGDCPLVALAGIFRPRLFVSRHVLERCTQGEIHAIVMHESGHALHRDNLKRLLLRSCPDLLALTRVASELEHTWGEAADRAADDHAAGVVSRLDLAAALVKVARFSTARRPWGVPMLAFCEGGIAERVKRLLRPPQPARSVEVIRRFKVALALVLALLAGGVLEGESFHGLHAVSEAVVQALQ